MASVLMAIVLVFFCCHSTKIIVNLYEALQVFVYLYIISLISSLAKLMWIYGQSKANVNN